LIVTLIVVGVLVWPTPKPAMAVVLFTATFDWDAHGSRSDSEITSVTVQFLNAGGVPIAGGGALTYTGGEDWTSWWTGFYNIPGGTVFTRMTAVSNSLDFTNNPATELTNWNGNNLIIGVLW
jgi:hypothetical protein